MEQGNTKIALVLFFSFGLVQANILPTPKMQDAQKDLAEWAKEVGIGVCSDQRYFELSPTMSTCTKEKQTELQNGMASTKVCSLIDPFLQCMDPLEECYTTQEINRFMRANLQIIIEYMKFVNKEAGARLENCQQYKDLASRGSAITGINMGIIIVIFTIVA